MEESGETARTVPMSRRSVLAAAAGGLAAGALSGGASAQAADGTITLVHDTHFHGRFEDAGQPTKDITAFDAVARGFREEFEETVVVGNGDDLAPSVLGLEYEGAHMVEALNGMDVDVVGAGNHEFDFGVETATERFEESEFPWVVANLLTPEGDPVPGTERWTTVETDEYTVGVFGLGVERFYDITDYPDDWQVLGNVEAAQEAVDALEAEGADLVVLASHVSSGTHERIAANVDGLDAIVGSHSNVVYDEPDVVEGTVIAEFGDEFDHLGRLTFDADSGELVDWERVDLYDSEALDDDEEPPSGEGNVSPVDVSGLEADPDLQELVDGYLEELEARLGEPVVESEVELNATFDNYAVETGWGNLMTDLMREVGDLDRDIDVAIQNAGGIRSNTRYGPGEITGGDVMDILPFPNEIEVYEVSGETLYEYIENSVRPMPGDFGAQPAIQVSGVSYEWWGHDGESRLYNVFVGGEPLDTDETYLVSTNDFVAGRSVLGEGELVLASGQFQGPYVKDRLEEDFETVAPGREHRIIRVDEPVESRGFELGDDTVEVTLEYPTDAAEGIRPETFRAVTPQGDVVEAADATADGDAIAVTFDSEALLSAAEGDTEPRLRVLGGFDPDDEHYGYEDEGETVELPVSSGYDHFKLRAELDAEAMLSAAMEDEETPTETDDGAEADESDDGETTPEANADGPGLGPLAALAGLGGGTYAASKLAGEEADADE